MLRLLATVAMTAALAGPVLAGDAAKKNPLAAGETWDDIRHNILGEVAIAEGSGVFEVDAPYRAHDAATVPIIIRQTDPNVTIERATVVVDENPAPMAGDFTFGPAMAPLNMEVRVRVDQYSNVRVVAETPEGEHFMDGRFVKASGGCSAPATKDAELALQTMGQMKLKHFEPEAQMSTPRREAQIMIRHPNYSGLQRDQVTHLFIEAHFIDTLEVFQGDELLFRMDGGISISENPVFRFEYSDNGAPALRVLAEDTEGNVFEELLPKGGQT